MKKKIIMLLTVLVAAILCLTACGKGTEGQPPSQEQSEEQKTETPVKKKNVDYDLTKMSSTMVYSQVLNFLNEPTAYVGKTVKAGGVFRAYYYEGTGMYYPAVVIADATACCAQGLEFVLKGDPAYPNGYPTVGEEIVVTGTFETYYEGSTRYCHLVNALLG